MTDSNRKIAVGVLLMNVTAMISVAGALACRDEGRDPSYGVDKYREAIKAAVTSLSTIVDLLNLPEPIAVDHGGN